MTAIAKATMTTIEVFVQQKERFIIGFILATVAILVGADIFNDSREGVVAWHIVLESGIALLALSGFFLVIRDSFRTKNSLKKEKAEFAAFRVEAENWRNESKKYVQGLSVEIDRQLQKWNLTGAEREVAFLLLKGFSLKDIAEIRKTAEKTARVQSMAIYAKAGLTGRSELSAFFLEDLLAPGTDSR